MGISKGEENSFGNFWAQISPENPNTSEIMKTLLQIKILFIDAKQKGELSSLYTINKELQGQIDDLRESLEHVNNRPVLNQEKDLEPFKAQTQQRIQDLVKEIDECIALINA